MSNVAVSPRNWPLVVVISALTLVTVLALLASQKSARELPARESISPLVPAAAAPEDRMVRRSPLSRRLDSLRARRPTGSRNSRAERIEPEKPSDPLENAQWSDPSEIGSFSTFLASQPAVPTHAAPVSIAETVEPPAKPRHDEGPKPVETRSAAALLTSMVASRELAASIPQHGTTEPTPGPAWPVPQGLLDSLDELATECDCAEWAIRTSQIARSISVDGGRNAKQLADRLENLHRAVARARSLAAQARPECALRLRAAAESLERRLLLWEAVAEWDGDLANTEVSPALESLRKALADVDESLSRDGTGGAWDRYLMLGTLRGMVQDAQEWNRSKRARIARQVLARMTSETLDKEQRTILGKGAFRALRTALEAVAGEGLSGFAILTYVNRLESEPNTQTLNDIRGSRRAVAAVGLPSGKTLAAVLRDIVDSAAARENKAAPTTGSTGPAPANSRKS